MSDVATSSTARPVWWQPSCHIEGRHLLRVLAHFEADSKHRAVVNLPAAWRRRSELRKVQAKTVVSGSHGNSIDHCVNLHNHGKLSDPVRVVVQCRIAEEDGIHNRVECATERTQFNGTA